jgi:hypothetical protein
MNADYCGFFRIFTIRFAKRMVNISLSLSKTGANPRSSAFIRVPFLTCFFILKSNLLEFF